MSRRSLPILLVVALSLIALGLTAPPAAAQEASPPAPAENGGRLAGTDRFGTAAAIARAAWPEGAEQVYLARADVPVDALAAGVLRDGPVLLAPRCGPLPEVVTQAIAQLGATAATLIGGPGALCDDLQAQLGALGLSVGRLAGDDRYGTATAISARAFPEGAWAVYLASGADAAPDAVAGGVLTDGPILTVPSDGSVPAGVRAELDRLAPDRVVALGGTVAIPDPVLAEAAAGRPIERAAGEDRYATALAIARRAFPSTAPSVYLARGDVFVDAVAGGALADGPIVLVPPCGEAGTATLDLLDAAGPLRVVALGGSAAVCDPLLASAATYAVSQAELPADGGGDGNVTGRQDITVSPLASFPAAAAVTEATDGTVVFDRSLAPETRALEPGEVLAVEPSPAAPTGLLRRVTDVTVEPDRVVVATAPADLADVIVAGTVDVSVPLYGDLQPGETVQLDTGQVLTALAETATADSARTLAVQAFGDVTLPGSLSLDFSQSREREVALPGGGTLRGKLDVGMELNLAFRVEVNLLRLNAGLATRTPALVRGELRSLDTEVVFDETAALSATWSQGVGQEGSWPLGRPIPLGTRVIFVGPVPVPITSELAFDVGAGWSAEAVATVGTQSTFQQRVNLSYRPGTGWTPSQELSGPTIEPPSVSVSAGLSGNVWIRPQVRVLVFDLAGPTAGVKVFADGQVTWSPDPAARSGQVDLGIEPQIGLFAGVPLFGDQLGSVDYAPVGDLFRQTIWSYRPDADTGGSGDFKATLTWDTEQDLDLHVIEPSGEETYYGHPTSETGGQLDRDANPNCNDAEAAPGGLENIFWPDFSAPPGTYVVSVVEYNLCGAGTPPYRIRIEVDGQVVIDEAASGPRSWEVTAGS